MTQDEKQRQVIFQVIEHHGKQISAALKKNFNDNYTIFQIYETLYSCHTVTSNRLLDIHLTILKQLYNNCNITIIHRFLLISKKNRSF